MSPPVSCVSTLSEFRYAKSRTLGNETNTVGERSSFRSHIHAKGPANSAPVASPNRTCRNSQSAGAQQVQQLLVNGRQSGSYDSAGSNFRVARHSPSNRRSVPLLWEEASTD